MQLNGIFLIIGNTCGKIVLNLMNKKKKWLKSKNLLDRAICLPINVLDKKRDLLRNSELLSSFLKHKI